MREREDGRSMLVRLRWEQGFWRRGLRLGADIRHLWDKVTAFRGQHRWSRKVFIIGTGRTGTHWIARTLIAHPEIEDLTGGRENESVFGKVTAAALDPRREEDVLPAVLQRFQFYHALVSPRHFLDQTHPNIWFADKIAQTFPDALFIGTHREALPTVSSMFLHSEVSGWVTKWKDFPIPNRFLGVTAENCSAYGAMTVVERCAQRWRVHVERMVELQGLLGERLLVVPYSRLMDHTRDELARIERFLQLHGPVPIPNVKRESRYKWKRNLTEEQIRQVAQIAEAVPPLTFPDN